MLGPGSSKVDYARGLNPSSSSTSPGHAQTYYDDTYGAPPPYYSQNNPDSKESDTDVKMSRPPATHTGAIYNPTDSRGESPLKVLENYDIVIILDDSYSMLVADGKGRRTRWDQAWDALATLVGVGTRYDRDGIEIHFLNERKADRTVKSEADLQRLRKEVPVPGRDSYTPTGDVLDTLLLEYRRKAGDSPGSTGVRKRIFLVITDGAATDDPRDGIIDAAKFFQRKSFPRDQVGIQFIQVGNDLEATKFLEELDTDLMEENEDARDIVDTIKSSGNDLRGDALIKALTGGFNRRQDRAGEGRR